MSLYEQESWKSRVNVDLEEKWSKAGTQGLVFVGVMLVIAVTILTLAILVTWG